MQRQGMTTCMPTARRGMNPNPINSARSHKFIPKNKEEYPAYDDEMKKAIATFDSLGLMSSIETDKGSRRMTESDWKSAKDS